MAFKVGEYVTSKERPELGKGRITDEVDFNQYIVKFGGGAQDLFEGSDLVAANACAKNAKIVTKDNFKTLRVGDKVDFRKSRYWKGVGVVTKVYGDDIIDVKDSASGDEMEIHVDDIMNSRSPNSCGVRSTNAAVNAALNGCGTARNADRLSKRFGDVAVLAFDDGRLGVRYVIDLGGLDEFVNAVSWDDAGKKCAAEARQMASLFEKRAASIKQAASWLEQNAK